MKKSIISIVAAFAAITMSAQTVNVHFKNGQTIQFPSGNVDYVDFSAKAEDPQLTAGEAVDLGLSVLWASCNLGATTPEGCGEYYSWGETKPKAVPYIKDNYAYYDSNTANYISIGNDISNTEYDAAKVNLGNNWRMPTTAETEELIYNCTWEWTQINGVNGYRITGNNGHFIFLPAAGSKIYGASNYNEYLEYWLSDRHNANTSASKLVVSSSAPPSINGGDGSFGLTIRPVKSKSN